MENLTQELISLGYLKTPRIINAFRKIDRKDFVPDELKNLAYINEALPIGRGQTISQPLTVAFMLELLQPKDGDKILDIGSGSGWQSSLLAEIVGEKGAVYAIELIPELKEFGENNASKYNFTRLKFLTGSAGKGLANEAPFDRIIAAASCNDIPQTWKDQLAINGRMVVPVKNSIILLVKQGENTFERNEYPGFVFVPFIEK